MIIDPNLAEKNIKYTKRIVIPIVVAAVLLAIYCIVATSGGHVKNEKYKLEMDFPNGWVLRGGSVHGSVETIIGAEERSRDVFFFVMVVKSDVDLVLYEEMDEATLQNYIDMACGQYGSMVAAGYPNSVYNDDATGESVELMGRKMVKFEASFLDKNTNDNRSMISWYTVQGNQLFTISGSYISSDSKGRELIDEVMNTIKIG